MTDERLDLTPLDLPPDRRAALTAAILDRGAPLLACYAGPRGPILVLAQWLRPALAAAALVAVIALGMLLTTRGESPAATGFTTAEALGFPGPVVAWAEAGRAPSLEELVVSLEEASQ